MHQYETAETYKPSKEGLALAKAITYLDENINRLMFTNRLMAVTMLPLTIFEHSDWRALIPAVVIGWHTLHADKKMGKLNKAAEDFELQFDKALEGSELPQEEKNILSTCIETVSFGLSNRSKGVLRSAAETSTLASTVAISAQGSLEQLTNHFDKLSLITDLTPPQIISAIFTTSACLVTESSLKETRADIRKAVGLAPNERPRVSREP